MKLFYSSKVVMLLEIESALFLPTEVNFLIQQTFNKHVAKKKKGLAIIPALIERVSWKGLKEIHAYL